MSKFQEILTEKRHEIFSIAARHGAHNVRVFGSVARGEADEQSDIDLLVEFERGRSLLDHAALLLELRETLGVSVVLRQFLIDEFVESVHPLVVSPDPGATEGGLLWPGNGHIR